MQLISLNVGAIRTFPWDGKQVLTAIVKEPIEGRQRVHALGIEGDRQADRRVHGGPDKAVYLYPSEHYAYWHREYPNHNLSWGFFGENLTTHGLLEEELYIGDVFRVGSAELRVTEPRQPCFKLAMRFGTPNIVRDFADSGFSGTYLAVVQEGEAAAGDAIEQVAQEPHRVPVTDIFRLAVGVPVARNVLERAVALEALSPRWREKARKRLETMNHER